MMEVASIPEHVIKYAQSKGADDVVCNAGAGIRRSIRFAGSEATISKAWESQGATIFLAKDKKVVHTSVNDFRALEKTVDDMIKLANVMKPSENYLGIADGRFPYRDKTYDKRIRATDEGLAEYAGQAIDAATEAGANRVSGVLYSSYGRTYQATSGGSSGCYEDADIEISLRAFAGREASGHSTQSVNDLDHFRPDLVGKDAGRIAKSALNPVIGDAGKFDVLFTPLAFANFLERVAGSASAGYVEAGMSFLVNKLDEQVAADIVTLHDDPTHSNVIRAPTFDNEGVPTRMNTIVEKGRLTHYLHNTSTASRFDTESTGNAGLIFPRAWNLKLEAGTHSLDDLVSGIEDGIYVTNLWYTRFQNYQTGDFSTIPRDAILRIKDGQFAGPVKDIRISENMLDIMKNIKAIGNDPRWIHWWEVNTPINTPHVVVGDVNITKSTQ